MSVMRCEVCERTVDTDYVLGLYIEASMLRAYAFFTCGPECGDRWLEEHGFEPLPEELDDYDVYTVPCVKPDTHISM